MITQAKLHRLTVYLAVDNKNPTEFCVHRKKMIEASRKTGKKLFVGFLLRYTGIYQEMAKLIHAGKLGSPILYLLGGFERYKTDDPFAWNRALDLICDTSCAFDCGSHYVDLMRWFSGAEAVSVHGMGTRINNEVPKGMFDHESYHIEFDDGSRGIYGTGWGYSFPKKAGFKGAIGPKAYLGIEFDKTEEGKESGAKLIFCANDEQEKIVSLSSWKGFEAEWHAFYRMINEDLDQFSDLYDAIASLTIVEAAHESALKGISININKQ